MAWALAWPKWDCACCIAGDGLMAPILRAKREVKLEPKGWKVCDSLSLIGN